MQNRNENKESRDNSDKNFDDNFEWSDRFQHFLFFTAYIMDYSIIYYALQSEHDGVLLVQSLTVAIILGIPILRFQITVGQYTRNGCLVTGEMFPITYGLGYSMLIMSLSDLFVHMFYMNKIFFYLLMSIINLSPPWMKCFSNFYKIYPGCISIQDIDLCPTADKSKEPCFESQGRVLSADIFKDFFVFDALKLDNENTSWYVSETSLAILVRLLCAVIMFVFLMYGVSKTFKAFCATLKIGMILCFIILLFTVVMMFIQPGAFIGLDVFLKYFMKESILKYKTWTVALRNSLDALRVAEGGNILLGSFMSRSNPDYWRPVVLIIGYLGFFLGFLIYYHIFLGFFLYKINMDVMLLAEVDEENVIFVLFPSFLGILPSANFFSTMYFLVLLLLNYFSLIAKTMVIERTLSLYFHIIQYSVYIRTFICTIAVFVSLCLEKPEARLEIGSLRVLTEVATLLLGTLQIIMLLLYGVDNFSDDIEYMMRTRVKGFIKTVWFVSPFIFMVSFIEELNSINYQKHMAIKVTFTLMLLVPLLIGLIVQMYLNIKKKDLIGILKHTDFYGPPNIEDKILRVLYNPRLTVKYRRRVEFCTHECLLNCNALKTALKEELNETKNFLRSMKNESLDENKQKEILDAFTKHRQCLLELVGENLESPD